MLEKIKTFKGGYVFGKINGMPKPRIRHVGIPLNVTIPLKQGFGNAVKSVVIKGDKVKAGQVIGIDNDTLSTPVHSSVNGIVIDIDKRIPDTEPRNPQPHNPQPALVMPFGETGYVVIESDGTADSIKVNDIVPGLDLTTREGVFKAIYMSGVSAYGVSGIPTPHNSSLITPDKVKCILINGTTSEPFSLPVAVILRGMKKAFITGLNILNFLYPDASIDIVLDSDKKETLYGFFNLINSDEDFVKKGDYASGKLKKNLLIHPVKPKYPQNHQSILVKTILGKADVAKDGFEATDYGIVILNIWDIIAIYEAVIKGKPVIDKIISLGGTGYNVNHGIIARIGTSVRSTLAHRHRKGVESRIVLNSIMRYDALQNLDIPVSKSIDSIIAIHENRTREFQSFMRPGIDRGSFSNTFLSFIFRDRSKRIDTNLNGEVRPCVVCNYCEYVCPVNILPFLISKYVTHDMVEEALNLNIFDCIECGLCSLVCPSKISIVQHIRKGKEVIRANMDEEGEDKAS